MDKNNLHKYIKHFLHGKLSEHNEKELLLWIKQSEENRNIFLKEQQFLSKKIAADSDNIINIKWQALKHKIELRAGKRNKFPVYRIATIAAAFIAGIVLTFLFSKINQPLTEQIAEIQNIIVPYGARTNTTLPDGSKVWLNAGTTLSYQAVFGETRSVTLKGEAYFEVVKGNSPFIVETHFGEVEVKGTSFNVRAYNDENLEAILVEGAVAVRDNNKKEVTLMPGQQAILDNQTILVTNVDTELYTSWTEGRLIFKKAYMPEVAKRLERWYNVKINLDEDPRLKQIWYSGTIEMESFSEVLELLKVTAPIDYTYNEKERIITIKYHQN